MNIEKIVNSKFYRGFEWFYRLVFLNLLIIIVSFSLASIPFLIFYFNQELGVLILIAIILFVILFIPASIASFIVIKHYHDDKTGNVFVLYFRYLIDTVKRVYKIELIMLPVYLISIYGLYYYWQILGPDNYRGDFWGYLAITSFVIEFFIIVGLLFMYVNLTFIMSYFRMKTFDYIKLSLKFSIRYMAQTILALVIFFVPLVLLYLDVMKFVPIYFILGISLPQFFIYYMIRNRFDYLARNVDDLDTENKYEWGEIWN